MQRASKYNSLLLGMVIGFILPICGVFLFYSIRHSNMSFMAFIQGVAFIQMSSALLSLAAVPNLAAFFLFLQTDKYLSARGIILSTLLIACLGFILKFTIG